MDGGPEPLRGPGPSNPGSSDLSGTAPNSSRYRQPETREFGAIEGPRVCPGPAGLALVVAGLLLLLLLGAAFVAPGAAVALFMALPALVALTILRKTWRRVRHGGPPK